MACIVPMHDPQLGRIYIHTAVHVAKKLKKKILKN